MVPAQAFAPNYCAVKAEPGILTGKPPVSWQVALLVHLSASRPGPCRKCLVAFYVLAQGCLRTLRQMNRFPWQALSLLWGCILALGLGGGSGESEGVWRGKGGWALLEISPLPLGGCVMLEQSLCLSERQCPICCRAARKQ